MGTTTREQSADPLDTTYAAIREYAAAGDTVGLLAVIAQLLVTNAKTLQRIARQQLEPPA